MKPLSERDENRIPVSTGIREIFWVGMKPLSERDENLWLNLFYSYPYLHL